MEVSNYIGNRIKLVGENYTILDKAREKAIKINRGILNRSIIAIRNIYKKKFRESIELINEAKKLVDEVIELVDSVDSYFDASYIVNIVEEGFREYVEAIFLYYRFGDKSIDISSYLESIPHKSFITGLADYCLELRNYFIDMLINNKRDEAKSILDEMEFIYDMLLTILGKSFYYKDIRRKLESIKYMIMKSKEDYLNTLHG